jgi:hypothetical protein
MFVIVLDELNIARVEYYFSEFLSLLELPASELPRADRRRLRGPRRPAQDVARADRPPGRTSGSSGTANNDDSTFAISDKVYDRAMVMDLNSRADPYSPSRPGAGPPLGGRPSSPGGEGQEGAAPSPRRPRPGAGARLLPRLGPSTSPSGTASSCRCGPTRPSTGLRRDRAGGPRRHARPEGPPEARGPEPRVREGPERGAPRPDRRGLRSGSNARVPGMH